MAEMLLFHHANGRTAGMDAFAERLRSAGHTVNVPDLYEGRTFDDLQAGVDHANEIGFTTIIERGIDSADGRPDRLVYAGFSLGVLPAQKLAQSRPGAAGAVLVSACVPPDQFGSPWPAGVPLQVHGMEADEFFVDDGDLDAARELVLGHDDRDLFLYPGDRHLFADESLPSYDPAATSLLVERVNALLATIDQA